MLGKNTKNRISCLKFFVSAVWIPYYVSMKGLVPGIILTVWKKLVQNGFHTVLLVELTELWKWGSFYFIQLIIIIQLN